MLRGYSQCSPQPVDSLPSRPEYDGKGRHCGSSDSAVRTVRGRVDDHVAVRGTEVRGCGAEEGQGSALHVTVRVEVGSVQGGQEGLAADLPATDELAGVPVDDGT